MPCRFLRGFADVVAHLKNYALGETSAINLRKAFAEVESHRQLVLAIDFSVRLANAQRELQSVENRFVFTRISQLNTDGSF